ncbi:hypothetical protein BH23VER1_BH23VER1_16540 [soil metagenome]
MATLTRPLVPVFLLALAAATPAQDFGADPGTGQDAPPAAPRQPQIVQIDDDTYQIGTIEFNKKTRQIEFPAVLNMRRDLLEFAIVNQNGKTHESLLATPVSPFDLNVALLLLGYKPTATVLDPAIPEDRRPASPDPPEVVEAAQVGCLLSWERPEDAPENAPPARAPITRWLRNRKANAPVTPGPFLYTGSRIVEGGAFAAELEGSIVALYLDPLALINNPREGNFDDETWVPAADLPDVGTAVTVTLVPSPSSPHPTTE